MKLTYYGKTHFEKNVPLRLGPLAATFNIVGEPVAKWVPLIWGAAIFSNLFWFFATVWAIRTFGLPATYSVETWLAFLIVYSFLRYVADESREAKT